MTDFQGSAPMRMDCVPKPRRRCKATGEPPPELVDRLDGLLPADALEEALAGLDPEQISGPGGLLSQLAGQGDRDRAGGGVGRSPWASAGRRGGRWQCRNGSTPKTLQT